jgi:hypothetical protein
MQDGLMTCGGRRIGRIAAVGAVALVLVGAVATPVEARTRESARAVLRGEVKICSETGGRFASTDTGASFMVACVWGDGTMYEGEIPYEEGGDEGNFRSRP